MDADFLTIEWNIEATVTGLYLKTLVTVNKYCGMFLKQINY